MSHFVTYVILDIDHGGTGYGPPHLRRAMTPFRELRASAPSGALARRLAVTGDGEEQWFEDADTAAAHGFYEGDEEAECDMRWRNPQARYDWYLVGGRYSGRLMARAGAAGLRSRGRFSERLDVPRVESQIYRDLMHDVAEIGADEAARRRRIRGVLPYAILSDGRWMQRDGSSTISDWDHRWERRAMGVLRGLLGDQVIINVDCHV